MRFCVNAVYPLSGDFDFGGKPNWLSMFFISDWQANNWLVIDSGWSFDPSAEIY